MSTRKAVVEKYLEGFRRGDHDMILSCLTDDVVWDMYGYTTLQGRRAFAAEIDNEAFTGHPTITVDSLVEEGDTVVAAGGGSAVRKDGDVLHFRFADVFHFDGDLVGRLETYQVNLG
ncbi:hypothetical protein CUT44_31000 [Streptomyces carminius]|uniref:SnoaL-like domain-containing protein n=1 Tax=Streptomyces carminius TaxID=2665496 RepID=A0A2M8LPV9_9ACTN|nr:nuclear transport factor 2 family protein [Streptomyces carminius]PJE93975.1 hypothetical protein CUT44_31000 [Streptomyces carminius]